MEQGRLPRPLRLAALAVIALSQLYLLVHSQEPLRLNVGDPWSDANVLTSLPYVREYGFLETSFTDVLDVGPLTEESYRYTHYPPLAEIFYGTVHAYFGVDSIGTMRLFAIAFSAFAMLMLFLYTRRQFGESVALVATMLWSSNMMWLMYADSIHQAPIMQASAFFGLWGLGRALDQPRRRYWVAAWLGSFACFLTSYDYWIFLPAAVLVTVYLRRGNPLRRSNIRPVLLCASGCVAAIVLKSVFVIGAVGWHAFVADLYFQFLERSTATYEQHFSAVVPTMLRRLTMVFSPMVWPVVVLHVVRSARERSITKMLHDGTWMLVATLVFYGVFSQLAAGQMLASQVALPFYSICTALVVVDLVRRACFAKVCGVAVLVLAPVWSFYWLHKHDRSFLADDDVAKVQGYLRVHDQNDFLVTNIMADGPIQAYFGRHFWPPWASPNIIQGHIVALQLMTRTGRDHFHVLMFKNPNSRFIDKSLWPLAMPAQQWSVTGWPFLWPDKTRRMIQDYDEAIHRNLPPIGATVVVSTPEIELYRVTKDQVLRAAYDRVPDTSFVDFGSYTSERNKLTGWSGQRFVGTERAAGSDLVGREVCPSPGSKACRSVLTKRGVVFRGWQFEPVAEFMLRSPGACDAELVIRTAGPPTRLEVLLNGTAPTAETAAPRQQTAVFARSQVKAGVNLVTLRFKAADTSRKARATIRYPVVLSAELRATCP